MQTFPMFLKMSGRRVIVFGGEEEAAQKTRLMLKTEAEIVVVAESLCPELAELARAGRVIHHAPAITADGISGAVLAFCASGCPGADAAHAALAREARVLVNAVDQPDLCDAFTPAIVDRDPVVVAIGTEGTAPVLARRIKSKLETELEPNLGRFAASLGRMRGMVAHRVQKDARRAFWAWVWDVLRPLHASGAEDEALNRMTEAALAGRAPDAARAGSVSLVGAGPGGVDLITLRGLRRLQEADVILHDALSDPEILELARRDAERIDVGKICGDTKRPSAWQQDRIARLMVQHASEGKHVVRLKCGDPGLFGRAREEMDACDAAGIPVEIVPGITAAFAASAEFNAVLTERHEIDAITLASARKATGAACTSAAPTLRPGGAIAYYMGVREAAAIEAGLLQTCPADLPCQIVSRAGYADARSVTTTLSDLSGTIERDGIKSPAILFVKWPTSHGVAAATAPVARVLHA
ncbi:uroporphyrin-III C-methyltransferase/precorrin-2 dehydrogenase/sirohydrochlorin ferrochelatase [Rubricella aquisinus]|uniref:Uroporphyrin-III C-methyltransferase/precorrin-2 dehydrogenase/sirohydrochlorin ferrochelatase n=1 Tax=Rubricella aquisinus TaxID=2028108 RepID=A0A840WWU9_9RHOB|nr:siroheme synthase CysG [Rubricella aquisinus]MBB5514175.1 uroporphyrin-III C-methyltransferase/precorrin-2 dehydrogenase/sirohydrochlorin ferrochelatase [Rubricella aquisinus]